MYVCGITPYDATHLGHAATYVTYDVLQRRLIDRGHRVRYVRNITDVDDDIIRAARQRDVHYLDLAFGETVRFDDDMAALNTLPRGPNRATGAIGNIRGLIDTLLTQGDAYLVDGAVYFDTGAANGFGSLARLGDDRMRQLAAEWGERPDDPAKRNPLDFVLWRPSDDGEPAWEARWGVAGLGGTSNAAPSPCVSWDPRSTSMAVVSISSSRTTSRAELSPKRSRANRSSGIGCTRRWCIAMGARCRSRPAISCSSATSENVTMLLRSGSRCCCTVIDGRGIGTTISSPTPRHDSLGGVGPVPAMLRSMPPERRSTTISTRRRHWRRSTPPPRPGRGVVSGRAARRRTVNDS